MNSLQDAGTLHAADAERNVTIATTFPQVAECPSWAKRLCDHMNALASETDKCAARLPTLSDRTDALASKADNCAARLPEKRCNDSISKNMIAATMVASSSNESPTDAFYKSLLQENPKSRLANEY